jgi:hypothetical protein
MALIPLEDCEMQLSPWWNMAIENLRNERRIRSLPGDRKELFRGTTIEWFTLALPFDWSLRVYMVEETTNFFHCPIVTKRLDLPPAAMGQTHPTHAGTTMPGTFDTESDTMSIVREYEPQSAGPLSPPSCSSSSLAGPSLQSAAPSSQQPAPEKKKAKRKPKQKPTVAGTEKSEAEKWKLSMLGVP